MKGSCVAGQFPHVPKRITYQHMITLKHLERFYPLAKGKFFYVLRDINLEVNEGDFVSIMGPSGAGQVVAAPRPRNARSRLER